MRRRSAALLALALLLPLPALAGEVVVKPGETLGELAERYGTSVERLMQLNGLRSPQDLWAGSRIRVPGGGGGPAPGSGGHRTVVEPREEHGRGPGRHRPVGPDDQAVGVEDGQIWKSLAGIFVKRCQERKLYPTIEVLQPITSKTARIGPPAMMPVPGGAARR